MDSTAAPTPTVPTVAAAAQSLASALAAQPAAVAPAQPVNLQPLVDLLGSAGEETTEFQHAKTAGKAAMVAWGVGLASLIAGAVAQAFGHDTHIGMIAGIAVTVTGIASQALVSLGYSASRATVKAAAGSTVAAQAGA